MELQGYGHSVVGRVRENNEDNFYCDPRRGVFAIADGVGGRPGGEVASGAVIDAIKDYADDFERIMDFDGDDIDGEHRELIFGQLLNKIQAINLDVYRRGRQGQFEGGIGTTTDLLVFGAGLAFILHIGDSRVYLIRHDEIFRITRDHTFSEYLHDHPILSQRYGKPEQYSNVLTRSIGGSPVVEVDTVFVELEEGDRLVMCTDGLTDYLTGADILEAALRHDDEGLVRELISAANQRGGKDNITVVAVSVSLDDTSFLRDPTRRDTFQKVRFLQSLELFSELEFQEMLKVIRYVEAFDCADGEVVLSRGEEVDGLYVVMNGEFSVELGGRKLDQLGGGEHFGEFALFGEPVRSADVRCVKAGQLLFMSGQNLQTLVREDAVLGNKLLWQLLSRMSRLLQKMLNSSPD